MYSKAVFAVVLIVAAIPVSHAEHFGRGSESPPRSPPSRLPTQVSDQQGRANDYGHVPISSKCEVKEKLAAKPDVPGRA